MDASDSPFVVVGKIASAYGIKGWVHVYSYTDPVSNILQYKPWYLQSRDNKQSWQPVEVAAGRPHGKQIVVQLEGCIDRNQAELLRGLEIAIKREQLPATSEDEVYWFDLEGLKVVNLEGVELGIVDSVMETGANDVLVVKNDRERLIPFVMEEFIRDIDLETGIVTVDWDKDF